MKTYDPQVLYSKKVSNFLNGSLKASFKNETEVSENIFFLISLSWQISTIKFWVLEFTRYSEILDQVELVQGMK